MDGDIQGELVLGKINGGDGKDPVSAPEKLSLRERKLRKWLEEMGW